MVIINIISLYCLSFILMLRPQLSHGKTTHGSHNEDLAPSRQSDRANALVEASIHALNLTPALNHQAVFGDSA